MHYKDLSRYSYTKLSSRASLLNLGWLDADVPFDTGAPPPAVIERIAVGTPLLRNAMRGIQGCPFCGDKDVYELLDGGEFLLGMSEVWLPSPTREVIYIAPSLLIHYVKEHGYLPPEEALPNIAALPVDEGAWDTPKGAYEKLVRRYGD